MTLQNAEFDLLLSASSLESYVHTALHLMQNTDGKVVLPQTMAEAMSLAADKVRLAIDNVQAIRSAEIAAAILADMPDRTVIPMRRPSRVIPIGYVSDGAA